MDGDANSEEVSSELDEKRVPCQDVVSVGSGVSDCTSDDPGGGHGPSRLNEDDKRDDGFQQEQGEEGDALGGDGEVALGGGFQDKVGVPGDRDEGPSDETVQVYQFPVAAGPEQGVFKLVVV